MITLPHVDTIAPPPPKPELPPLTEQEKSDLCDGIKAKIIDALVTQGEDIICLDLSANDLREGVLSTIFPELTSAGYMWVRNKHKLAVAVPIRCGGRKHARYLTEQLVTIF